MSEAAEQEGDGAVVSVSGVKKQLGGEWVHRGVNLEVREGEVLALVGESGGGKTMLLHQIIGLMTPTAGDIRVFGHSVHNLESYDARLISRRWGVLFQQGALFSALNVFDNIAFPMRELRKDGAHIEEGMIYDLVRIKLDMVGLKPDVAWRWPAELSGGMIKRVALARALALEAELLLLDEPTAGLDPKSAADFDELLIELHRELGLSAFMIAHDLATLAAQANRVAVLVDGRILTTGTLNEVARVDHPFIKDFFRPRLGDKKLRSLWGN